MLAILWDGNPSPTIEDHTTYTRTFDLADFPDSIADIYVSISITHPRPSDLEVSLTGPDTTSVALFRDYDGSGRDMNITFDDKAASPFDAATAPFDGRYRPSQPLAAFLGKSTAGDWTIQVADTVAGETGSVNFWSLTVDEPEPELTASEVVLVDYRDDVIAAPSPGDEIALRVHWNAIGLERIGSESYIVRAKVDGDIVDSQPLFGGVVQNGDHAVVLRGWDATVGEHAVEVTIDADESVAESDESNNVLRFTFVVAGPAPQTAPFAIGEFGLASSQRGPLLAMSPDGQFLVGGLPDVDELDWHVQHYDQSGATVGAPFPIEIGANVEDAVALRAGGELLAAGASRAQNPRIIVRRFDAAGVLLEDPREIFERTVSGARHTAIDQLPDGRYVVVWSGVAFPPLVPDPALVRDEDLEGIYARVFDGAGQPRGPAILVNTTTTGRQLDPDVALAPNGEFVVVWESPDPEAEFGGFLGKGQRFDATGTPIGGEFTLAGVGADRVGFTNLAIGMDAAGNYVVAGLDRHLRVIIQRFDRAGIALGDPREIADSHGPHALAMHSSGAFVITWVSSALVKGQAFDAHGTPVGTTFNVTPDEHAPPFRGSVQMAMSASGDFVVAWAEGFQRSQIYARLYQWRPGELGAPIVGIDEVLPDPREQAIDSMTIRFSEAVTGFDVLDLRLERDGSNVLPLTAEMLSSADGGRTWTLASLEDLTDEPADYTLTLISAGAGITAMDGRELLNDATESWRRVAAASDLGRFVTILTHGFNPNPFDWEGFREPWVSETGYKQRVKDLVPESDVHRLEDFVETYSAEWDSSSGWLLAAGSAIAAVGFTATGNVPAAALALGMVRLSMTMAHRQAEAAARQIVTDVVRDDRLLGGDSDGVSIHLIGHSRGAAVNARVSQILSSKPYNFKIDQYTSLDGFSTDWPSPADLLGDIAIVGVANADTLLNYRVEEPLGVTDYNYPFSEVIDAALLEEDWRAPDRDGFTDIMIEDTAVPSRHTNVSELYFNSKSYLSNSPLGRALAGLGTVALPATAEAEGASRLGLNGSMPTRFRDFTDGSFEELGQLWRAGLDLSAGTSTDDPFLLDWLDRLNDQPALITSVWNAMGLVDLAINDATGDTAMRLTQSDDTSLGQFVVLDERVDSLQFDLTIASAGPDDRLEILLGETVLKAFSLTESSAQGRHLLSLAGHESTAETLRFRLAGPVESPAVIELDDLRIVTDLAIDAFVSALSAMGPPAPILLTADDIADPQATLASVTFYRESNGMRGLQAGVGGDELLHIDSDERDAWSVSWNAAGSPADGQIVYAQAQNVSGETGETAIAIVTLDVVRRRWQNPANPLDVDQDGHVAPLDALIVINSLNSKGFRVLEPMTENLPFWFDSSGDGAVSPLDALLVINHLNDSPTSEGEQEHSAAPRAPESGDRFVTASVAPLAAQTIESARRRVDRHRGGRYDTFRTISQDNERRWIFPGRSIHAPRFTVSRTTFHPALIDSLLGDVTALDELLTDSPVVPRSPPAQVL